jgi:hypothetical protein
MLALAGWLIVIVLIIFIVIYILFEMVGRAFDFAEANPLTVAVYALIILIILLVILKPGRGATAQTLGPGTLIAAREQRRNETRKAREHAPIGVAEIGATANTPTSHVEPFLRSHGRGLSRPPTSCLLRGRKKDRDAREDGGPRRMTRRGVSARA